MASEDYRRSQDSARTLRTLEGRVEALERGASLRSAGIGGGGMHVNGGSVFVREGGHVEVSDGGGMLITDGGDVVVDGGELVVYAEDGVGYVQASGGRLWFRRLGTEQPGRIDAAEGPDGRTVLRMRPPTGPGGAADPTVIYVEGQSGEQDGMVHLRAGGQVQVVSDRDTILTAGTSVQINAAESVFIESDTSVNLRAGTSLNLAVTGDTHRVYTAGNNLHLTAPETVTSNVDFYAWGGLGCAGVKSFKIAHPLHDDRALVHAATESPVAGLEYWGEATLDDTGTATITLPDYFEAIAAPDARAVLLTPIDEPAALAASRVTAGEFTVRGPAGASFSWLVKARRGDAAGQFDVEPLRVDAGIDRPADPE